MSPEAIPDVVETPCSNLEQAKSNAVKIIELANRIVELATSGDWINVLNCLCEMRNLNEAIFGMFARPYQRQNPDNFSHSTAAFDCHIHSGEIQSSLLGVSGAPDSLGLLGYVEWIIGGEALPRDRTPRNPLEYIPFAMASIKATAEFILKVN